MLSSALQRRNLPIKSRSLLFVKLIEQILREVVISQYPSTDNTHIHTYIHTYTHIHTHTLLHTYINTYIHTHTYIHTYIHTQVRTYIHYIHTRTDHLMCYLRKPWKETQNVKIFPLKLRRALLYVYILYTHIHTHTHTHTYSICI